MSVGGEEIEECLVEGEVGGDGGDVETRLVIGPGDDAVADELSIGTFCGELMDPEGGAGELQFGVGIGESEGIVDGPDVGVAHDEVELEIGIGGGGGIWGEVDAAVDIEEAPGESSFEEPLTLLMSEGEEEVVVEGDVSGDDAEGRFGGAIGAVADAAVERDGGIVVFGDEVFDFGVTGMDGDFAGDISEWVREGLELAVAMSDVEVDVDGDVAFWAWWPADACSEGAGEFDGCEDLVVVGVAARADIEEVHDRAGVIGESAADVLIEGDGRRGELDFDSATAVDG